MVATEVVFSKLMVICLALVCYHVACYTALQLSLVNDIEEVISINDVAELDRYRSVKIRVIQMASPLPSRC